MLVRKNRAKAWIPTRKLHKVLGALHRLERHHSRPRYSLKARALRSFDSCLSEKKATEEPEMSWKREQNLATRKNAWQDSYWQWPSQEKQQKKKKQDADPEKFTITGWDGKRIELGKQSGPSSGASSSQSQVEQSLREENRKLKEAMRASMDGKQEIPPQVRELVKIDPREAIKEKQRLLNVERKQLNRAEKIKQEMEKNESRFSRWKEGMQEGLLLEEKRHASVMAEFATELKEAEEGPSMDVDRGDISDPDGKDTRIDELGMELSDIKFQMSQMVAYTQAMEQRNQGLTEQVQQLIGALTGQSLIEGKAFSSPQQLLKVPKTDAFDDASNKRPRSPTRSAGKEEDQEKIIPDEEEMDAAELKGELLKLPEVVQARILNIKNEQPVKYRSATAMRQLIADVMTVMSKSMTEPEPMAPALVPFGKAARRKMHHGEPYTTRLPIDGGNLFMTMTPPKEEKASLLPLGEGGGLD